MTSFPCENCPSAFENAEKMRSHYRISHQLTITQSAMFWPDLALCEIQALLWWSEHRRHIALDQPSEVTS